MTITVSNAVAGNPVLASDMAQVFHNVNKSPGIALITANTTWSVPDGVHKFRVTVVGGGASGRVDTVGSGEDSYSVDASGSDGRVARAYYSGVDIGTSFTVTVGAGNAYTGGGGTAGSSSFGPDLIAPGGRNDGVAADNPTWPSGSPHLFLAVCEYCVNVSGFPKPYGSAGFGSQAGRNGLVVIEW